MTTGDVDVAGMSDIHWVRSGGSWTATGRDGTHWEIVRRSQGHRYAIYVARWDKPDWTAETLEEAKRLVAEIDARPPISLEQPIPDPGPVVQVEGDPFASFDDVPPPSSWADCESCGSSACPERVKPIKCTYEWWTDPAAIWRCPDCRRERDGSLLADS
jgi:hypothetical protein